MIDRADLSLMVRTIGSVVRDYMSAAMLTVKARMDTLEQQIKDIPAGPQGPQGEKGQDGERGQEGARGPAGESIKGDTGDKGDRGERGEKGEPGESIKGEVGAAGPQGPAGPQGEPGAPGESVKGEKGDPGESIQGPKGEPGESIKGDPGPAGKDADPVDTAAIVAEVVRQIPTPQDGKSVDLSIVRELIEAEVEDAVKLIPVPKDGAPGPAGKDAEPPHPDTLALLVVREVEKQVSAIPKPENGKAGEPGRDASELDPLPAIDSRRAIPRGTWAQHGGCLVRANTNTTPGEAIDLKEWDVMVRGYSTPVVVQGEDLRTFTFETRGIDGAVTSTQTFSLPVVIYRGVFKDGREYAAGDSVTWGGSTWHCNAGRTTSKPGTNPADWTLSSKVGQPGKDGKDALVGPPPEKKPVRLA